MVWGRGLEAGVEGLGSRTARWLAARRAWAKGGRSTRARALPTGSCLPPALAPPCPPGAALEPAKEIVAQKIGQPLPEGFVYVARMPKPRQQRQRQEEEEEEDNDGGE